MAKSLTDMIIECLKLNRGQRFTGKEIANWILQNYPDWCRNKQARSKATVVPIDSDEALLQQISGEIGARSQGMQKKQPQVKTAEGPPRKYYFSEASDSAEIAEAESGRNNPSSETNTSAVCEIDLYPILKEFLYAEWNIYSMRIDEKKSSNKQGTGGNKWLYPDLVGMEDLSADWHREVKDCIQQYGDKRTKLWSFEVKVLINRSNVREAFFQAVSNSSWANLAYLVARDLGGSETVKELRILSSLHGIGFIHLDVENPPESQILIPAKERGEIAWDTVNRLTQENTDFRHYIKLLRKFYQTGETQETDWAIPN